MSRKAGFQFVGIWTVVKSSEDSSGEVPIKSKERQESERRRRLLINVWWSLSWKELFFQLSKPSWRKSREIWKISYKTESRKDEAIFLCFAIDRLAWLPLIWFTSHVNWWSNCIPIIQYSTEFDFLKENNKKVWDKNECRG